MKFFAALVIVVGANLVQSNVPGYGGICCFQNHTLDHQSQSQRNLRDEVTLPAADLVATYNVATLTSVLGIGAFKSKRMDSLFEQPISCGIDIYRVRYVVQIAN